MSYQRQRRDLGDELGSKGHLQWKYRQPEAKTFPSGRKTMTQSITVGSGTAGARKGKLAHVILTMSSWEPLADDEVGQEGRISYFKNHLHGQESISGNPDSVGLGHGLSVYL